MYKIKERKGFTLAELLIVVAIIAVLVAVAIPVFTTQLEKSREATDIANVRSAYAECVTKYLTDGSGSMTVAAQQKQDGWQTSPQPTITTQVNGTESKVSFAAKTSGNYTVTVNSAGSVSIN
jgi:type IV pilus assembly protein PilA